MSRAADTHGRGGFAQEDGDEGLTNERLQARSASHEPLSAQVAASQRFSEGNGSKALPPSNHPGELHSSKCK